MDLAEIFPTFGLRVRTPRLELRAVDPDLAVALIELADGGVHDPGFMPFLLPWTDVAPPQRQRDSLRFYLDSFAGLRPERWRLIFAVVVEGELVGSQDAFAVDFPSVRSFESGSWLGRRFQGRGIGSEMRAAILHLGFAGLGAKEATTGAWADNGPSLGVTGKLGYEPNGSRRMLRRGVPDTEMLFRLTRARWEERRRDDIEIDGLDAACLAFLGLGDEVP